MYQYRSILIFNNAYICYNHGEMATTDVSTEKKYIYIYMPTNPASGYKYVTEICVDP
jgi:hypothetical protein